jgi:RNA polymerase sigma factor (sigma-70 family)
MPPRKAPGPNDDGETSTELLARVRSGDSAAREHLFARYLPRLARWARGRLPRARRDLCDTDDLIQDTLLRSLGHVTEIEAPRSGAFGAYLRQAVLNRIRDELRRTGRRPPGESDDIASCAASAPSPLEQVLGRETLARYEAALSRLAEDERALVIGRLEHGFTHRELAGMTGRPSADAARMGVTRALVRLAKEMALER